MLDVTDGIGKTVPIGEDPQNDDEDDFDGLCLKTGLQYIANASTPPPRFLRLFLGLYGASRPRPHV